MGKRSRWLFPHGLFPHGSSRYSCSGRRGLSRGVVCLFVAALVVEIRPSARSVKVVVPRGTPGLCSSTPALRNLGSGAGHPPSEQQPRYWAQE